MTQVLDQRESTKALVAPAFLSLQNVGPFNEMIKGYLRDVLSKFSETISNNGTTGKYKKIIVILEF